MLRTSSDLGGVFRLSGVRALLVMRFRVPKPRTVTDWQQHLGSIPGAVARAGQPADRLLGYTSGMPELSVRTRPQSSLRGRNPGGLLLGNMPCRPAHGGMRLLSKGGNCHEQVVTQMVDSVLAGSQLFWLYGFGYLSPVP